MPKTNDEREKKRELNESIDITKNCTFKPEISENSKLISNKLEFKEEKIINRLHRLANNILIKKNQMRSLNRSSSSKENSFRPKLNETTQRLASTRTDQRPLFERYRDLVRSKNENLMKMRKSKDQSEESDFIPEINSNSQRLAKKKRESSPLKDRNVYSKLYNQANSIKKENYLMGLLT